jgi:sporulation protein YlmC with PRC-barrel domain
MMERPEGESTTMRLLPQAKKTFLFLGGQTMNSKRVFWSGLVILGLVGVLCPYALAAERAADANRPATAPEQPTPGTAPQPSTAPSPTAPGGMPMTLVRTSQLIGKEVKGTNGENLGVIHDLVLTPDYQGVSYAALSYGGVFGVGRKLYAIPWQALHVSPTGEITTSLTKEQFSSATSFPNNNWPSQGDTHLLSAGAAGAAPTAPPARAPGAAAATNRDVQMRRVTHLTGMEVKNPENQDLGDIEDFVVNASDGHIVYDIISFGGVAGMGEKYAAVPANAIRLHPQAHAAMLNTTKQTLESVAFNPGEYPNLSSPEYMQRLSKLFAAAPAGGALGYVPGQAPQAPDPTADERAWGPGGPHGKAFNPSNVKTITGTVESVGGFKPEGAPAGVSPGLRLRVRTTDGKMVTVYAGPASYAEQKDFYVMPGDRISITGSETKIRSRIVILASELKKGTETLELRDKSGKPLWSMGARAPEGARPGAAQRSER